MLEHAHRFHLFETLPYSREAAPIAERHRDPIRLRCSELLAQFQAARLLSLDEKRIHRGIPAEPTKLFHRGRAQVVRLIVTPLDEENVRSIDEQLRELCFRRRR